MSGVEIKPDDWRLEDLPLYLKMNFKLVDEQGQLLAESRDLNQLKQDWSKEAAASFRQLPDSEYEKTGLTGWDFEAFPEHIVMQQNGLEMTAYPALVDRVEHVDLTLMDTLQQAKSFSALGLRRLFMLAEKDKVKYLQKNLPDIQKMCLHYANVPAAPFEEKTTQQITPCEQLKQDLIAVAFDRCFLKDQDWPRDKQQFEQRLQQRSSELINTANQLARLIAEPLSEYHAIAKRLSGNIPLAAMHAVKDIREQLGYLLYQGFVHHTPDEALQRLPAYFRAIGARLDKLKTDPTKDRQRQMEVQPHWQRYLNNIKRADNEAMQQYRWMIEELRISVFAQEIGTAYPVSSKRLDKQWSEC